MVTTKPWIYFDRAFDLDTLELDVERVCLWLVMEFVEHLLRGVSSTLEFEYPGHLVVGEQGADMFGRALPSLLAIWQA